jgi:hypothetical protein
MLGLLARAFKYDNSRRRIMSARRKSGVLKLNRTRLFENCKLNGILGAVIESSKIAS